MKVRVIDGEAQIDWKLLKKVYRHATRKTAHPQPDLVHLQTNSVIKDMESDLQRKLDLIIDEITRSNDEFLNHLQEKFTHELLKLQQRIENIENLLKQIKQNQDNNQSSQMDHQNSQIMQIQTPSKQSSRSFIYIEQQTSSFIDRSAPKETQINENKCSLETSRCNTLQKSQGDQGDLHSHSKKIFSEQSELSLRFDLSQSKYRLQTKESSVFEVEERSLKEEVACLKHLIEAAHNIKIYDYPNLLPVKYSKDTEQEQTQQQQVAVTHAYQHLINENQSLRLQLAKQRQSIHLSDRYKRQLSQTHQQLQEIRLLLHQTLQITLPPP